MKIAIHHKKWSFSDRWIAYCKQKNIPFKIVNCYESDIVEQLADCDALMWHHYQDDYRDILFSKVLLFSLEQAGTKVFPDFHTSWHFDDKVGQKYLLEAIDAPLVPSYVFYDKKRALDWADKTSYPKVFKLRSGAGAANVCLVHHKREAFKKINRAFGKGFSQFNRIRHFQERYYKMRKGQDTFLGVLKATRRLLIPPRLAKMSKKEKGYVYFQEFIPNNSYDIRLIVIGGRYAYGLRRMNRQNDFRASGSSNFKYDQIPLNVVEEAFRTSKKLKLQSCAFDFIFDQNNNPLIIEMSYGYGTKGSSQAPGYWTADLNWHEEEFNPQGWMVEVLLEQIN